MSIHYAFKIDCVELNYEVDIDRVYDLKEDRSAAPEWTQLGCYQCTNCTLSKAEYQHCPAAIDLQAVVTDFQALAADQEIEVTVDTPQRQYFKRGPLEEGLRSLMGLIMATSACPILSQLKPNARNHLPFTSYDEFVIRSVSMFLLRQYFRYREGFYPDWDMHGLIRVNQALQLVNQAFWQRLHTGLDGDSNLSAILGFFKMSSSVSYSLEKQLQRIKTVMLDEEQSLAMGDDPTSMSEDLYKR